MAKACKTKELNGRQYRCFFELTLQVMGGKWKPIILYHLSEARVLRFSELRRGMPGVTERMLTRQLRELEADGLVHRTVYREVPPRVEYGLTELGAGLVPILDQLRQWGEVYEDRMGGARLHMGEGFEPRSGERETAVGA
ncbi:winged helix-turn-helix transcriptional regulator [Fundidesulfovibrio agrisoli]|uniref:winged helix-turn-helix transcriptional regulator n=1 Tax=Fundidesulfovibrio agrisoli TaxID=2922717 RepID=UPI001FAD9256|nr:helix-turn-helix domain-containing protein [Fundidesulfovibrio agrisoli]